MSATRVKICGLTAALPPGALEGVHFVGLNAVPTSRRYVLPAVAAHVVASLPPEIQTVLVVANTPPEQVHAYLAACRIDWLQFHGAETAAQCRAYRHPYFKAFAAVPGARPSVVDYLDYNLLLVDAPGPGGAGVPVDLSAAAALLGTHAARALVAGGLNPANVGAVVRTLAPFGVDVASGVESAPGVKDPTRIRDFVAAVREAQP